MSGYGSSAHGASEGLGILFLRFVVTASANAINTTVRAVSAVDDNYWPRNSHSGYLQHEEKQANKGSLICFWDVRTGSERF